MIVSTDRLIAVSNQECWDQLDSIAILAADIKEQQDRLRNLISEAHRHGCSLADIAEAAGIDEKAVKDQVMATPKKRSR